MPQIQPGQVLPGQSDAPKLYGVDKVENTIPFQEKMMRLFKPQEFVTIKNIDTEACYWQYMPVDSEQISFSEDGMQKIVNREQPEMWVIAPGETEVLIGASAYRALDAMYKNYMAHKVLNRFRDPNSQVYDDKGNHLPRNFNYADGGAQDDFLVKAYLGKATPTFDATIPEVTPISPMEPAPRQPISGPTTASQPIATTDTNPDIKPLTPVSEADDLPKPKTTEGAPLAPVTYADPDSPNPMNAVKELTSARQ